jgi:hypothetical protein
VFVSPEKASRDLDSCLARPGDVLFTQRGTLGQVGLIPHDSAHREYVVSQSQMKMTCADGVPPEFVVLAFKRPETLAYIEANGAASGVPHINLGFLRRFPIIIPPRDVLISRIWPSCTSRSSATSIHGPDIAPDEPASERASYGDVVLRGRLEEALTGSTPRRPAGAVDAALRKLLTPDAPTLVQNNRAFHKMLRDGVEVEVAGKKGRR